MVRTPHLHCWGLSFNPWVGTKIPTNCSARPKNKERIQYSWHSYPWVPHSQIQPTMSWQYLERKKKKFSQDPKSKHLNLPHIQQLFTHHLHCIYNYLHSIYIVLSIITNLKVIWSIWEDKPRFYANTTPFLYKRLEHPWFLYWNQSPTHTEGWDCIPSYFGFQKKNYF